LSLTVASSAETVCDKSGPVSGEEVSATGPLITDITIPRAKSTALIYVPVFLEFTDGKFNSDWHRKSSVGDYSSPAVHPQLHYCPADPTERIIRADIN
jgi:hypothetical protein